MKWINIEKKKISEWYTLFEIFHYDLIERTIFKKDNFEKLIWMNLKLVFFYNTKIVNF